MRKNSLKEIAYGLMGSFVSRNNDCEGYWALGKLYSEAAENKFDNVQLRLYPAEQTVDETASSIVQLFWSKRFVHLIHKQHLNIAEIDSATITVTFNLPKLSKKYNPEKFWLPYGDPFEAEIQIVSSDIEIKVRKEGWCAKHDPSREMQSRRFGTLQS